jgi:hypothetical protein
MCQGLLSYPTQFISSRRPCERLITDYRYVKELWELPHCGNSPVDSMTQLRRFLAQRQRDYFDTHGPTGSRCRAGPSSRSLGQTADHSSLATRYPLATVTWQLIARNAPLLTDNWQLSSAHSPLATRHSPLPTAKPRESVTFCDAVEVCSAMRSTSSWLRFLSRGKTEFV